MILDAGPHSACPPAFVDRRDHRVDLGPHSNQCRTGVVAKVWPMRLTSRDANPRMPRRLFGSGKTPEGRAACAAYLRNALWWTQKASLRISAPGLPYRRTLISKPRMTSAGALLNGSLFVRRAGGEELLANGVLLRM